MWDWSVKGAVARALERQASESPARRELPAFPGVSAASASSRWFRTPAPA